MELCELLSGGKNRVEIIPADAPCAEINSIYFQADGSSALGLLITQSGGVVAENVIRLLGSNRAPEYRDINMFNIKFGSAGMIILGDDIFGGVFTLNTGAMPETVGNVFYLAPDTMELEDLEISLTRFFEFLKNGDIRGFYGRFSDELYEKCRGMDAGFDRVLSFYPPQWSAEFKTGKPDIRAIDIIEHYKLVLK